MTNAIDRRASLRAPAPFKRRALRAAQKALYWSGAAAAWGASRTVGGVVILMYHSVARRDAAPFVDDGVKMDEATFETQMHFLARRRNVISMDALLDQLRDGSPAPSGTVVLTFDDGYLDNLEVVAPILSRYGLPALLYLATAYVRTSETQWVDRLHTAMATRTRHRLDVEQRGIGDHDLDTTEGAQAAYGRLCDALIECDHDERERVLGEVAEQLAPTATTPRLTMSWDEVRRLRAEHPSFAIGGHTMTHADLSEMAPEDVRSEVVGCHDEIRRETGEDARHFSFPYGRASAPATDVVRGSGFSSAVCSGERYVTGAAADPFALNRVEAPPSMTLFRLFTSGAWPAVSKCLFGRA